MRPPPTQRSGLGWLCCPVCTHQNSLQRLQGESASHLHNSTTTGRLFQRVRAGPPLPGVVPSLQRRGKKCFWLIPFINSDSQHQPAVIVPITSSKISGPRKNFLSWPPTPYCSHAPAQKPHWNVTPRGWLTGAPSVPHEASSSRKPSRVSGSCYPSNFLPHAASRLELSSFTSKIPAPQPGLQWKLCLGPHPSDQRPFRGPVHSPTGSRVSNHGKPSPTGSPHPALPEVRPCGGP